MTDVTTTVPPPSVDAFESHRRALTGYCYRMLGSASEAEDAVQETMLRAWRAADRFEGRASVKNWLYRIATNVCIDMGRSPQRRARPVDLGPARPPDAAHLADVHPEEAWVTPIQDSAVIDLHGDPADVAAARDTIRLAFIGALQRLSPKQRAAVVLCDVLRWSANDVAELLESSSASVNSSLQRARAVLAEAPSTEAGAGTLTAEDRMLVERYTAAFEQYDMDKIAALLRSDVVQTMPPYAMWLRGIDDVIAWYSGAGVGCAGSRLVLTAANGCPAFAQYRVDPAGGHTLWALQVLEVAEGRVAAIHSFLDTASFSGFGLPDHLD